MIQGSFRYFRCFPTLPFASYLGDTNLKETHLPPKSGREEVLAPTPVFPSGDRGGLQSDDQPAGRVLGKVALVSWAGGKGRLPVPVMDL